MALPELTSATWSHEGGSMVRGWESGILSSSSASTALWLCDSRQRHAGSTLRTHRLMTFTDSFLTTASGQGGRVWLPLGFRVRVTALCGIWALPSRTASPDAWNSTVHDSCLWEISDLSPLCNNNNSPSWLFFADTPGSQFASARLL